jgi:hypothetical protein
MRFLTALFRIRPWNRANHLNQQADEKGEEGHEKDIDSVVDCSNLGSPAGVGSHGEEEQHFFASRPRLGRELWLLASQP